MNLEYIHGLPNTASSSKTGIDIAAFTDGELYLTLLKRRYEIFKSYAGNTPVIAKSIAQIEKALSTGIHKFKFDGIQSDDIKDVNYYIKLAQSMTDRDYFDVMPRDYKLANIAVQNKIAAIPDLTSTQRQKWILNYLVRLGFVTKIGDNYDWNSGVSGEDRKLWSAKAQNAFEQFILFRKGLESKFEDVGHHLLYEFAADVSKLPVVVQTKNLQHRQGIDLISNGAIVARSNVSLWADNGIIKNNVAAGLSPLTGNETVFELSQSKIGALPLKDIAEVFGKVAAALIAAKGLVEIIKGSQGDYINQTQGFATENFGPQQSDWASQTNDGLTTGNNLPLILGGAALVYYLTQKK